MKSYSGNGKIASRTLAVLLSLLFLLSPVLIQRSDADSGNNQHWNIMLVMDGSYGFREADPKGIRFEAVNSFLDTLWNSGDYVGAVVTQVQIIDNPDTYNNSIVLDTWKDGPVKLDNNRDLLKEEIRKAPVISYRHNQDTDIGSAVLLAAQRLQQASAINGLPGAIVLLTNSVTNFNNERARSNKSDAISLIESSGIKLGAVYYNSGASQETQIRELITAANGLSGGDLTIADYYTEVYNAADIPSAFDTMLRMLGISVPENGDYFTSSGERTFSVPGTGIDELNLRFRTTNGMSIPSGLQIDIIRPNGSTLSEGEMKSIYSKGETYINYKITTDLIGGEWKVRLTLPELSSAVQFDRIFNTSIETGIDITPDVSTLHSNMCATVTAYLMKSGARITDTQAYTGYSCKLLLTNAEDGTVQELAIEPNRNGEYTLDLPLDFYGKYYVKTEFICNEFYSESRSVLLDLTNRTPVCASPDCFDIRCSIFENEEYSIDCSKYAKDTEDPKLTYTIGETTLFEDALRMEDSTLYIDPYNAGWGENTVYVRVVDSQGGFSTIRIPVNIIVADIKAVMETSPSADSLHAYLENGVSVTGYMTDAGEKVAEAYKYKDYTCYLVIRDAETKEVLQTVELPADGSGTRSKKVPLDFYGKYEAYVMFDGEFPIASSSEIWDLTNREPKCRDLEDIEPLYIRFFKNKLQLQISSLISDTEDSAENLRVELLSEDPNDAVRISDDGKSLSVNLDLLPTVTEIFLKVTDSQGASSNFRISYAVKDLTVIAAIVAGAVLLLIALIVFLMIRKKNSIVPEGICTLEFEFVNDDDDEKTLRFEMTPPGKGSKRKTNLYEMIQQDMRRGGGMLRQACDGEHVEFGEVEKFIEDLANELKKIEILCVIGKQKGRGKIGKVKVVSGKDSTVLYNSARKVLPGGHAFTVSYQNRDSEASEEYYTGTGRSNDTGYQDDSYDSY